MCRHGLHISFYFQRIPFSLHLFRWMLQVKLLKPKKAKPRQIGRICSAKENLWAYLEGEDAANEEENCKN